jgi:hypothetical protein
MELLEASDTAVLVECVKFAQKSGLKGPEGNEWKAYVQVSTRPNRKAPAGMAAAVRVPPPLSAACFPALERLPTWAPVPTTPHHARRCQGLPAAQRHQDPARHARASLLAFLDAAAGMDKAAAKLLKRYAKWRDVARKVRLPGCRSCGVDTHGRPTRGSVGQQQVCGPCT